MEKSAAKVKTKMSEKYFFCCPVCKGVLLDNVRTVKCEKGHSFDKSKEGYVNLLRSQKSSSAHHGDDKLMLKARQGFLNKGYYKNLNEIICEKVKKHAFSGMRILDCGCGEGYYLSSISTLLKESNIQAEIGAVDISKEAVRLTVKNVDGVSGAVASVFDLPVENESADILLNIFSPLADGEFLRVLKQNGTLIRVTPREDHLFSLKKAVYDIPIKNEAVNKAIDGLSIIEEDELIGSADLICNEDIKNLFMMTPYYYKTGKADQKKLDKIDRLTVETCFDITVYSKKVKE